MEEVEEDDDECCALVEGGSIWGRERERESGDKVKIEEGSVVV